MGLKHLAPFAIPFIVSANATIQNEFNDTTHDVPARAGDFPFMVSVLLRHPQHICGGSLLDATTVLTAADCVAMAQQHGYTSSDLIVRAGSLSPWSDGWLVRVVAMITHPEFSGFKSLDKDVAILKLSDPIPQSDTIKYATLARAGSDPIAGTVVSAAGWSHTRDHTHTINRLEIVTMPVAPRLQCEIHYMMHYKPEPMRAVTQDMFCAQHIKDDTDAYDGDSCSGDRGGPVVDSMGTLVGVVSWGAVECGIDRLYGVNARVGSLRDFIDRYL